MGIRSLLHLSPWTWIVRGWVLAMLVASPAHAAEPATAKSYMVAAANPLAVEAGYQILREGGSAIDAMIATQLVLNLVEPQSSGIGGGAFLIHYNAGGRELIAYDGRETAPLAAGHDLFLDAQGEPMKFFDAVVGGRLVGVPGTLRLLYRTHVNHGRLPWALYCVATAGGHVERQDRRALANLCRGAGLPLPRRGTLASRPNQAKSGVCRHAAPHLGAGSGCVLPW